MLALERNPGMCATTHATTRVRIPLQARPSPTRSHAVPMRHAPSKGHSHSAMKHLKHTKQLTPGGVVA